MFFQKVQTNYDTHFLNWRRVVEFAAWISCDAEVRLGNGAQSVGKVPELGKNVPSKRSGDRRRCLPLRFEPRISEISSLFGRLEELPRVVDSLEPMATGLFCLLQDGSRASCYSAEHPAEVLHAINPLRRFYVQSSEDVG
jgi:hypothetical protein